MTLDREALRVLGALMEKEMTTPEAYPLSLNSLVAAANQKTSRDPVMELSEEEVRRGLEVLQLQELVSVSRDARVPKYEHRIRTVLNLRRDETAVLCLLILRGPQTAGEIRGRADRMFSFEELGGVQAALDRLAGRETPLVASLPRLPGSREVRSMHLLGDAAPPTPRVEQPSDDELGALRRTVAELETRVAALEAMLGSS
jgi:uncharacterized protein YceH (UPF0502 family)